MTFSHAAIVLACLQHATALQLQRSDEFSPTPPPMPAISPNVEPDFNLTTPRIGSFFFDMLANGGYLLRNDVHMMLASFGFFFIILFILSYCYLFYSTRRAIDQGGEALVAVNDVLRATRDDGILSGLSTLTTHVCGAEPAQVVEHRIQDARNYWQNFRDRPVQTMQQLFDRVSRINRRQVSNIALGVGLFWIASPLVEENF